VLLRRDDRDPEHHAGGEGQAGDPDHLLRIAAGDLAQYREWFMEQLAPLAGVDTIESQVAFCTIKSTTELPLA
jgi:hypothetical protein